MPDPELVARARRAAASFEPDPERWRALQGLAEIPAQSVVGYASNTLGQPWRQSRASNAFNAEEPERSAEVLERASTGHGAADRDLEPAWGPVPGRSRARLFSVVPTINPDILVVTRQLSASQR
jgi:hypothetical protein